MKSHVLGLGLLFCLIICNLPAKAQQSSSSDDNPKHKVDLDLPGTFIEIADIVRIDPGNVVVILHLATSSKSPATTFFGVPGEKPSITNPRGGIQTPYTLSTATATDPVTGIVYKFTKPLVLKTHYWGASATQISLPPNSWFPLAAQFKIPVPAPNPDGTIPKQKIDLLFPRAQGPIKDVEIPPFDKKKIPY